MVKLADTPRIIYGQVAQLVDAYGLGPYAARLEGSSPSLPTIFVQGAVKCRGSNPLGGIN